MSKDPKPQIIDGHVFDCDGNPIGANLALKRLDVDGESCLGVSGVDWYADRPGGVSTLLTTCSSAYRKPPWRSRASGPSSASMRTTANRTPITPSLSSSDGQKSPGPIRLPRRSRSPASNWATHLTS